MTAEKKQFKYKVTSKIWAEWQNKWQVETSTINAPSEKKTKRDIAALMEMPEEQIIEFEEIKG